VRLIRIIELSIRLAQLNETGASAVWIVEELLGYDARVGTGDCKRYRLKRLKENIVISR
jgi:hypothetical protein